MKKRWESRWLRRLWFVAANAGIAVVVMMMLIAPARDGLARRETSIAEQRALLARFRSLAAQESAVAAASREALPDTEEFLVGSNDGVVNADLQTRLKGMVESQGARLRSVRTLPAQTSEQVKYIGCRIEIAGTLPSLHRAFAAIEAGKPYLFVRGAIIQPAPLTG